MIDNKLFTYILKTAILGRDAQFLETCDSTNQVALDAAMEGAPEGLLVTTEVQTAGRGRQRRLWHSPPGLNLYFSILLRPQCPQSRLPQLAMLAALALHQALRRLAPELPFDLKWPNDLWLRGRKLSGILCECPPQSGDRRAIVVGIGLNVNALLADFSPELQETATSLKIAAGHDFDRATVLAAILNALEPLYQDWLELNNLEPFLAYWNQYDLLRGKTITVLRPADRLTGTVLGVTAEGLLRLAVPGRGEVVVSIGDVHLEKA